MDVNLDIPEQQNGLMVFKVNELAGRDKSSWYKGFSIQMKVDSRYIFDDPHKEHYTARLWTDDSILVGYPAATYEHYTRPEDFENEVEEGVWIAIDEARNKFVEDPTRHTAYTLLQFPKPTDSDQGRTFRLSVREISENTDADETELELSYFPIYSSHDRAGLVVSSMCIWNVVRLDVAPGKRGKPDQKPMSKAAKQLEERIKARSEFEAAQAAAAQMQQQQQNRMQQNWPTPVRSKDDGHAREAGIGPFLSRFDAEYVELEDMLSEGYNLLNSIAKK